jgi:tetratricopeptide (TPR) repeat protein
MPSQLNRVVFRKLLASEPIAHRGCLRPYQSISSCSPHFQALPRVQRRSFMNIFKKPERVTSEPRMAPGLEKMMEYSKMERLSARLPPPADVLKAVTDYFSYKWLFSTPTRDRAIPDLQAQHLRRCLNYLDQRLGLSTLDKDLLRPWICVFDHRSHKDSTIHRDMVELLFRALGQNKSQNGKPLGHEDLRAYVRAMCAVGGSATARDQVIEYTKTHGDRVPHYKPIVIWELIIQGFLREMNEQELLRTFTDIDKYVAEGPRQLAFDTITRFYTIQENIEKATEWYNKAKEYAADARAFQRLQRALLRLAMRTSNMKLGQLLIRDMAAGTPTKFQWEMILEWAAATGKGADEIDRMIGVMERANQSLPKEEWRIPDTTMLNKLVKVAVDRKDPYLAERLVAVGKARSIQPDALTLIYQMQYRLAVKDVDGALTVYKHLQSHDLSKNDDVSVVNELIQTMCASGRQDFDSIMNVAADLSDRQARFYPETVSALSVLHLSRDEVHDVIDLLNTHVYNYDMAGRASVQSTLIDYCLGPTTTTAQAWDTYIIVKQVFDDTVREQRVKIMNEFFRRQRPDMAVHVFNHMRAHTRQDTVPTVDTYVACLSGIGKTKDEESLEVVYNQLKLDFNIEPNTLLYNALMKAYTSCESPRTALGFWDDIATSREGPNINSIHLALRACEDAPWGDEKARKIWIKLNRTGIELDQDLWASYAAALVGNGNIDSAINSLEKAHVEQGLDMDTLV